MFQIFWHTNYHQANENNRLASTFDSKDDDIVQCVHACVIAVGHEHVYVYVYVRACVYLCVV